MLEVIDKGRSGSDRIIAQHEVHSTATTYGTQAEIFPGMGHNMMIDGGWRNVAERIAAWLNDTVTPPRS